MLCVRPLPDGDVRHRFKPQPFRLQQFQAGAGAIPIAFGELLQ